MTGGQAARDGAPPRGRPPATWSTLTVTLDPPGTDATTSTTAGLLGLAGLTSIGAGAIHAAAIGVHSEHRPAVLTFTALAALQLAWGVVALVRGNRLVAGRGLLIATGALAGWALAKVSGIPFVAGLDVAEPVHTADGLAAGLALTSVLGLGAALWPEHDACPRSRRRCHSWPPLSRSSPCSAW